MIVTWFFSSIYFSGQPSQNLLFEISFSECSVSASKQVEYLYRLRKTTGMGRIREGVKEGNASGITSSKNMRKERETKQSLPSYPETGYKGAYLQAQ